MNQEQFPISNCNFYDMTVAIGATIHDGRTAQDVMVSLMSEVGELAEEVNIQYSTRNSYKTPGADGVVGEGIDVILCVMDLLHISNPELTHEELMRLAALKLQKWYNKSHGI